MTVEDSPFIPFPKPRMYMQQLSELLLVGQSKYGVLGDLRQRLPGWKSHSFQPKGHAQVVVPRMDSWPEWWGSGSVLLWMEAGARFLGSNPVKMYPIDCCRRCFAPH